MVLGAQGSRLGHGLHVAQVAEHGQGVAHGVALGGAGLAWLACSTRPPRSSGTSANGAPALPAVGGDLGQEGLAVGGQLGLAHAAHPAQGLLGPGAWSEPFPAASCRGR